MKANYTYLSDGTKAAAYTSASAGKDYVGSFVYARGSGGTKTLESVAFGGGRIRKSGSSYLVDYHITDHLGSVRAIVNASGAWTAIDPLAEKYYGYSPYLYCAGSPILIVDPSGKRLFINGNELIDGQLFDYSGKEIVEKDMDDFTQATYRSIKEISKSKTGNAMIEFLQYSDFSFNIVFGAENRFIASDVRGVLMHMQGMKISASIFSAQGVRFSGMIAAQKL